MATDNWVKVSVGLLAACTIGLGTALGVIASKGPDYKLTNDDYVKVAERMDFVPGPKGDQGPAGAAGPQGESGKDYVLTDADIANIASKVTPVPGPRGDQGIQGLVGPQGERGYQGEPGKGFTITATVTHTVTPTPTQTPAPTLTQQPYQLPRVFEVSYGAVKSIVARDGAAFSEASGVELSTWCVLLNGKEENESELSRLVVDLRNDKYLVEVTNAGTIHVGDRSGSVGTLADYLVKNTTETERRGIVEIVAN